MKTAVFIPDNIYDPAEELAERLGTSRSQLYAQALSNYLERYGRTGTTERLNQVYDTEQSCLDDNLKRMQYASLPKEEW